MAPLLVDNVESSGYVNKLIEFYSLSSLSALCLVFVMLTLVDLAVRQGSSSLRSKCVMLLTLLVVKDSWLTLWEIIGKGPTDAAASDANDIAALSQKSQCSLTYMESAFNSGFDWHKAVSKPTTSLFVEVAGFFFLVLSILVVLVISIIVIVILFSSSTISPSTFSLDQVTSLLVYVRSLLMSIS